MCRRPSAVQAPLCTNRKPLNTAEASVARSKEFGQGRQDGHCQSPVPIKLRRPSRAVLGQGRSSLTWPSQPASPAIIGPLRVAKDETTLTTYLGSIQVWAVPSGIDALPDRLELNDSTAVAKGRRSRSSRHDCHTSLAVLCLLVYHFRFVVVPFLLSPSLPSPLAHQLLDSQQDCPDCPSPSPPTLQRYFVSRCFTHTHTRVFAPSSLASTSKYHTPLTTTTISPFKNDKLRTSAVTASPEAAPVAWPAFDSSRLVGVAPLLSCPGCLMAQVRLVARSLPLRVPPLCPATFSSSLSCIPVRCTFLHNQYLLVATLQSQQAKRLAWLPRLGGGFDLQARP